MKLITINQAVSPEVCMLVDDVPQAFPYDPNESPITTTSETITAARVAPIRLPARTLVKREVPASLMTSLVTVVDGEQRDKQFMIAHVSRVLI